MTRQHYIETKRIRYFIITIFLFCFSTPSSAVLKEADLSQTLAILREEITAKHNEMMRNEGVEREMEDGLRNDMIRIIQKSSQNGLMLYSQKNEYIFDMTYACNEATQQYQNFTKTIQPFNQLLDKVSSEIERYDSLLAVLESMPSMALDEKARIDKNVCVTLATDTRNKLTEQAEDIKQYQEYFNRVGEELKEMNDYAIKKYNTIQQSIFVNGGDSYFSILSQIGSHVKDTEQTVLEKYRPKREVMSQWDVRYLIGLFIMTAFYGLIAFGLNIIFFRFILHRGMQSERLQKFFFGGLINKEKFRLRRPCITLATTAITFALILGTIHATIDQNFIQMASSLLMEYAWLLAVILLSLLFRYEADKIKSGFRIYTPIILVGFLVISFRIILIPNELVNLIFPPILLVCAYWQWHAIKRLNKNIPRSDIFYTYITLIIFIFSAVCSWMGYTLMSVQVLIWWLMELTCIQTITCILHWVEKYADKHCLKDKEINKTWGYYFVTQVVIPALGVLSFLFSVYWAATVFNLTEMTVSAFDYEFLNQENIKLSVKRICMVLTLFFLFRYLSRTSKALLKYHLKNGNYVEWQSRNMMYKNVLQTVIWAIFILMAMSILHVGNTWLMVIAGGLSTGIGFAMKDIIENIYYGISLMAGRIHVGDTILCDGVRGKVANISYTSTMVEVDDGSVMAFQNSQLFTKNYKNLTKNHGWELMVIPIGVAYGSNVNEVRKMLKENLEKLDCYDKGKGIKVYFAGFGDSSVDLKVKCWIKVTNWYVANSQIQEVIYNTLNANNISIPFPQRDLHIIKDDEEKGESEKYEFETPTV